MKPQRLNLSRLLPWLLLMASLPAWAQQAPSLYDPEPPANSAYVRVILASPGKPMQLSLASQPRKQTITFGEISEYRVLPAGKHRLELHEGKSHLQADIVAPAGKAMTLVFTSRNPADKPLQFNDQANTNKLKSVLTVYQLAQGNSSFDIIAGAKGLTVFSGLTQGSMNSRVVNPLSIDFSLTAAGNRDRLSTAPLSMDFGGTYSLLVITGPDGKPQLRASANRVERYTGK